MSVWSEVQTCIWPSRCHCHSLSLASVKSRLVYLSGSGSPGQRDVKRVCVCVCVYTLHTTIQLTTVTFHAVGIKYTDFRVFFNLAAPLTTTTAAGWRRERERVRVFYDLQARIATQTDSKTDD